MTEEQRLLTACAEWVSWILAARPICYIDGRAVRTEATYGCILRTDSDSSCWCRGWKKMCSATPKFGKWFL